MVVVVVVVDEARRIEFRAELQTHGSQHRQPI